MLMGKEGQKQIVGGEQGIRLSSNFDQALSLDTMLSAAKSSCKPMGRVLPTYTALQDLHLRLHFIG